MKKAELRRSLLKKRQSMPVEEWREKSDRICTQLLSSPLFTQAKTVLAYFSFRQEPDLSPLFTGGQNALKFAGKNIFPATSLHPTKIWGFPRCVGNDLSWHVCTPNDSVNVGTYGIPEPHPDAPSIDHAQVDLILVPCVACEYKGYRLGYGGGYYDRLLASPEWASKPTIGIVFDFAYLQQLPIEPWDKPLDTVCTESEFNSI